MPRVELPFVQLRANHSRTTVMLVCAGAGVKRFAVRLGKTVANSAGITFP